MSRQHCDILCRPKHIHRDVRVENVYVLWAQGEKRIVYGQTMLKLTEHIHEHGGEVISLEVSFEVLI